ncbi:DUF563 domain-containing protein [Arthrobacter alpinus]|uniref:glycosyltransferase family 61 protein n=1 Tax=Arthrobacter alpinus TaxID=656366 RepID=UPI00164669BF|nr:glycosyltransferase 61 family protein [Arthrobacter alpinus]
MKNDFEHSYSGPLTIKSGQNVGARGLAEPQSIGQDSWDDSSSTARYALDMTGMCVDPSPPQSLIQGLAAPLGSPHRAADIMQPDKWICSQEPLEPPSLWLLKEAHVMGGSITGRTAEGQLGGQLILTKEHSLIPASYAVTDGEKELSVDHLIFKPDGIYLQPLPKAKYLSGIYFFIGAANNHFGHTILEGVTRLWALDYLQEELRREIRFIVYENAHRQSTLDLLEHAGIPKEKIVSASPHDIIEKLIVPDAAMRSHRSISAFQTNVWDTMASRIIAEKPSKKTFLSRRNARDRPLQNHAKIEKSFTDHGYDIVVPEELSIREQIKLAKESISLAGCVGSQMYLACFQQSGASNIVIAPRNFFLKDDILISSAKGNSLEVIFGSKVDFRHPKNEMDWSVDIQLVELAIRSVNSQIS